MTTFQIISLAVLGVTLLVQFAPSLPRPAKSSSAMLQIEQVIAIRDSSQNPEVIAACKALLQAMLL